MTGCSCKSNRFDQIELFSGSGPIGSKGDNDYQDHQVPSRLTCLYSNRLLIFISVQHHFDHARPVLDGYESVGVSIAENAYKTDRANRMHVDAGGTYVGAVNAALGDYHRFD